MCNCAHYISTCGHSWISMTNSCGPGVDLLNCMNPTVREIIYAPPGVCPQCHRGFADGETIQMVNEGPCGVNPIPQGYYGWNTTGQFGNVPLLLDNCWRSTRVPALTGDPARYDHRLTGPYGQEPVVGYGPRPGYGSGAGAGAGVGNMMVQNWIGPPNNGLMHGDRCYGDGRRDHRSRHSHRVAYTFQDQPVCAVM